MLRILMLPALVATLLLLGEHEAAAQRDQGLRGYCPAGTCGKGGYPYANNPKNCSAANCKKR
jgi:hypothetical protein